MIHHPGNRIGDAWFFVYQDRIHCFYLTCPEQIPPHTQWNIGHATSGNLIDWEIHDLALKAGPQGSWDDVLATGSVLRWDDRFWMAYTGHKTQQTGMAVSDNLFSWEKLPDNPLTSLDERFYEPVGSGARKMPHWRDPFLFEDSGWIYQMVCASRNDGPADSRAALGLSRSQNMVDWEILPPPGTDRFAQEFECPQLYAAGGRYYLLFSCGPEWFSRDYRESCPPRFEWFASYSLVGDSPFGPFHLHGTGQILNSRPFPQERQPYACQLVEWEAKFYLLGTIAHGNTSVICDPIEVEFTPEGIRQKA
jgi:beta-fructofuranosidase